jgi:hypothetical protein
MLILNRTRSIETHAQAFSIERAFLLLLHTRVACALGGGVVCLHVNTRSPAPPLYIVSL